MITDKKITFATANLFNFIEPPGAFYDFENIYESEAWREKCRWTQNQIQSLEADIVGLQEVFSIDAAKALFVEMGYPYFASVDEPMVENDYIYSKPVVALASKYPITQVSSAEEALYLEEHYATSIPTFSRKPLCALVNVPDIGTIAVYVCHLKSQRATESHTEEYEHEVVGRWLSSQQRGWEAVMLRLFMEQNYAKHPLPTILMGDMNQPLNSDITGLLTSRPRQPSASLQLKDSWHLYQSTQMQTDNQAAQERIATHYYFARGNVLDYILLSQEFQQDSPYSLADICRYQVLDSHLVNPIYERDKQASDHAFVGVTARFIL
ncbi:endonuclease/exonuclease/phosphatase family protein [Vibrio renipiscarius]|uniref:Endonuclease n=1 Tax=Vibrio renipiscarius TaxID=1461322 RepID=A0A0C2NT64_9VIBR|nr:endonuclease/exonuclease/phosphatase family protein [Vibrio renipiscarius]KII79385.1 endonuclease [Vibrio renipiscarius]KII80987.1 endonuclease [Vibrio renipiscarius]